MSLCLSQNSHSRTPVLGISVIFPNIGHGFGPGGNGYGFFFLSRSTILTAAYATIARIRLLTISVLKNMMLYLGVICTVGGLKAHLAVLLRREGRVFSNYLFTRVSKIPETKKMIPNSLCAPLR